MTNSLEDLARRARLLELQERANAIAAQPTPPAPTGGSSVAPDMQGGGPAFRRALANPFQLGDEIAGLVGMVDPESDYQLSRDEARWLLANDRQEHPTANALGQITSDMVVGGAIGGPIDDAVRAVAPFARGAGTMSRMARGGLAGGMEGVIYGAASGDDMVERAQNAATLGLVGTAGGALIPLAMDTARYLGRPVASALNIGNDQRGMQRVLRALDEAGVTPDDIDAGLRSAADDGQDMFTVADVLGPAGGDALSGVTTQPGAARQLARDVLELRLDGNTRRLSGFVSEAFDAGDATAAQQRAAQITSRADDAAVNYGAASASAGPVNLNNSMAAIDDLLGTNPMLGETNDLASSALGNRLADFRRRMGTEANQLIDFDEVRQLRTDLRLWREQNPRAAAITNGVYDALTEALADASPDFRAANDAYRSASQLIDAGEAGSAVRRTARADDIIDQYNSFRTPEERNAFRLSFADQDLARIEQMPGSRNPARTIYGGNSPSMRSEALAMRMVDDPELFARRVGREDTMTQTANTALRGSPTASRLAEQGAANGEDIGIIANLLSGRFGAAGGQVAGRALNALQGSNEGTRLAIARALMSSNPSEIPTMLNNAMQQSVRADSRNRVAAGAARGIERALAAQLLQ
jgi:hypothetical protein